MSLFGSIVGGALGLIGNAQSNSAAAAAADKANAFTTEQLQNRHQWEVEDLKKAGLNPILSAGGTPSIGSSAKAEVFDKGKAITDGANSATSARLAQAQIDNLKTQSDLNRAGVLTKVTEADYNSAAAARQRSDTASTDQWREIKRPLLDISRIIGGPSGRVSAYANSKDPNWKGPNFSPRKAQKGDTGLFNRQ